MLQGDHYTLLRCDQSQYGGTGNIAVQAVFLHVNQLSTCWLYDSLAPKYHRKKGHGLWCSICGWYYNDGDWFPYCIPGSQRECSFTCCYDWIGSLWHHCVLWCGDPIRCWNYSDECEGTSRLQHSCYRSGIQLPGLLRDLLGQVLQAFALDFHKLSNVLWRRSMSNASGNSTQVSNNQL